MGKPEKVFYDKTLPELADRCQNRIRVYQKDNGEVVINYRNVKITLFTPDEIREWKDGMAEALEKLRKENYFPNDL